jgi:hypothetical protein
VVITSREDGLGDDGKRGGVKKTLLIFSVTTSRDDGCRVDGKRGGVKKNTHDFHSMGVSLAICFILFIVLIERELTINNTSRTL